MKKSWLLVVVPVTSFACAMVACSSGSSSDLMPGDDSVVGGEDASTTATNNTPTEPQDSGSIAPTEDGGVSEPADAGFDSGIPSCTGLAYCEDFESYGDAGTLENGKTIGPWKINVGGKVTMSIDTDKPYSGKYSLHITEPANDTGSSNGLLHQNAASGGLVTGNDVFGRAMIYYSTSGGAGLPQGHSWVFQSQGNSAAESNKNVSMNVANGGTDYFLNYHSATSPEQSVSGGKPAGGKWLCMQWEYNGSGATPADEGKIIIDGTVVVDAKKQTPNWDFATPWTNFDFGFQHYQAITNSMDVYLDDFALDDKEIPCP